MQGAVQNRKSHDEADQKLLEVDKKVTMSNRSLSEDKPVVPFHLKTIRASLYIASKALNIVYIPIFIYRVFERKRKCSPVTDPILRIPAEELARRIRRREISCESVIQAYITRIKEVNPLLNAVIDDRFTEALEDAKRIDLLVATDGFLKNEERTQQEYPLLGVPVTVKGSIAVKGLKHTSGSLTRSEVTAESDAEVVELVKKAGGIPLLTSNVPELCMSWETTNKLTGTTRNPHDTTRTCGGSSGGEASLLAAGASVIGLGSDIAGSLRLPAHYCGVWGHKPTPGVVSFKGHYPSCPHSDQWGSVFTLGPMARYASDLRILLDVIVVPDKREMMNLHKKVNIQNIKVYYSEYEDYYWQKPNRHCREAVKKVVEHFNTICDTKPERFHCYLSHNAPDLALLDILSLKDIDDTFDGNANGAFRELFRYTTFRSRNAFMTIACGMIRRLASNLSDKQRRKVKSLMEQFRQEFEQLLGKEGVLIVPSFPMEAPKHGDVLRTAIWAGYQGLFNTLGFPVTNCPVGVTKAGLPVGVQVVSLPQNDRLTLAVAEEIEATFGGWIEPKAF